jgi:hypothetical protein
MSRIMKSERRREHKSVRKQVAQSKLLFEVANKCSLRASGHALLRTDRLLRFIRDI